MFFEWWARINKKGELFPHKRKEMALFCLVNVYFSFSTSFFNLLNIEYNDKEQVKYLNYYLDHTITEVEWLKLFRKRRRLEKRSLRVYCTVQYYRLSTWEKIKRFMKRRSVLCAQHWFYSRDLLTVTTQRVYWICTDLQVVHACANRNNKCVVYPGWRISPASLCGT